MFSVVASMVLAAVSQVSGMTHERITPTPFTAVEFADAFWKPHIDTNRTVTRSRRALVAFGSRVIAG